MDMDKAKYELSKSIADEHKFQSDEKKYTDILLFAEISKDRKINLLNQKYIKYLLWLATLTFIIDIILRLYFK